MTEPAQLKKPYDAFPGLLLTLVFVLLYLAFLGVRPLFMPDEVRYGEIAREMLVSGDWIVPRLNGLLYFEKPPFGHWVNAISLSLFGENRFAVRFASVFFTGVSAGTVFYLGSTIFHNHRIALLAVFIFLTTIEVQGIGTYGVLDSTFSAVLNVGLAAFVMATLRNDRSRYVALVIAGIFFGIAFLAKGFLALALPVLIVVPWLFYNKQYRLLLVESWIVVVVAAAVIAPWAIAIHIREPDFWNYFFWTEHIKRFAADDAQHGEPIYFYLMYLPLVAFPWLFLLPAAIRNLRIGKMASACSSGLPLLFLWSLVPLVLFSIASGKLVTYILPCFVPFSLIVAAGLIQGDHATHWLKGGLRAAAALPFLLLVAVLYVSFVAEDLPAFEPGESTNLALLIVSLTLAVLVMWIASSRGKVSHQIVAPGVAVIFLLACMPWVFPEETLRRKAPANFVESVGRHLPADTIVVTNGSFVRAVSWSLKRSDLYVIDMGGETTYGLNAPDAEGRFLDENAFRELVQSGRNVVLFCKGRCRNETMASLPENLTAWAYGSFTAYLAMAEASN